MLCRITRGAAVSRYYSTGIVTDRTMDLVARWTPTIATKNDIHANSRIVVLYGPEAMLKRQCLGELVAAMEAAHGKTQTFTYDGQVCELADVLDELRSFSLMQQYKIVIVDESDQFVSGHREALERYAAAPVAHATLVLRGTRWNRGRLDKLIRKVGALVKCEMYSAARAREWLVERSRTHHQRQLSRQAAAVLTDRIGVDLGRLDGELGKLALSIGPDQTIGTGVIEQVVGRSSDDRAYAIQNAVLSALTEPPTNIHHRASERYRQVIEKIQELLDFSGQPEILVMYYVADLIRKLYHGTMMEAHGSPPQMITRQLGLWPAIQPSFLQAVRRLDPQSAATLFDEVVRADARSKSGLGVSRRNLEGFCIRFADLM